MKDIVFVLRRSPDWESLANDYEAGKKIDIRRYKPDHDIPGFPENIEHLIGVWNRMFKLNFFRCRQLLKEIALRTVRNIPDAMLVNEQDYPRHAEAIFKSRSVLFYMDDDDLFAPDIHEQLTDINNHAIEIVVFPLVRMGQSIFTFVRANENAHVVVGKRADFDFRFQTNNYGILTENISSEHIPYLSDHVEASEYANRNNLTDGYFDKIISATNKTPCSASGLPGLLQNREHAIGQIRQYIDGLKAVALPDSALWLHEPKNSTIELFENLIGSARTSFVSKLRGWLK